MGKIKVTIWNEFVHERDDNPVGEYIRKIYPDGIHEFLKEKLQSDDLEIRAVSLNMPDQGLPDEVLNDTDVLMWWGHCAHHLVDDELVARIRFRVLHGMGLIVMHSGHYSKIFRTMMGTACRLRWREAGEKERLWVVDPTHPITQGVPETFTLPHSEMYGERFDIPEDGKILFMSWFEGGNVFRSGVLFQRDYGKIFYFSPGHETYPIYHDENILKILGNAIRFVNPACGVLPDRITPAPQSHEPITSENPLLEVKTACLHQQAK